VGGECSLEGVVGGGRLQKYTWVYCTGHVGQMVYTYIRQSGSQAVPDFVIVEKNLIVEKVKEISNFSTVAIEILHL
jgi:hypothetical protein